MVKVFTQLDTNTLAELFKEHMILLIKCKGMGLYSLFDRCHIEFIGETIQGIPPILDKISPFIEFSKDALILYSWNNGLSITVLMGRQ